MKRIWMTVALLTIASIGLAQENKTLLTIADEKISVEEFLAVYNKNNTNNVIDKKSLEEYLELFINFKLKVKEAQSLGMDTADKFVSELSGYRRQLAQPYLVDKDMNDKLVEEAYERMKWDVAAYHLLIRVNDGDQPSDTLAALNRIKELRKNIRSEKEMLDAINAFKADPDDMTIGEDLGYFTAFAMVYPFESAAYNTPVGSVSQPVRTKFGYHIIYVKDKRPARGEVKVAHILIKSTSDMADDARGTAKDRIDEIYKQLKEGANFRQLVEQYSEDKGSVSKGGSLPWFGTGRMAPVFEDAAFALKKNGDISEPVFTNYGWHILMREDQKSIASLDELRSTIKKRIERDQRGSAGRSSLIEKLKSEYALTYNVKNRDAAHKFVTNELTGGTWKLETKDALTGPVLTITDNKYSKKSRSYTQKEYLEFMERNQRKTAVTAGDNTITSLSTTLNKQWEDFIQAMLVKFEEDNLEFKYPEFKALMQEYHDGILLFDLMDQRVWSKAVKDTTGLSEFYESHKTDYMWPQRVDASVYTCANASIASKTQKLAKQRLKKGTTDSEILAKINENNALDLVIKSGLFAKGDNEHVDVVNWQPGIQRLEGKEGRVILVQVYKNIEPTPKSLNEARGLVTSAYQNQLEAEWIKELRSKFSYQVDQNVFQSINK